MQVWETNCAMRGHAREWQTVTTHQCKYNRLIIEEVPHKITNWSVNIQPVSLISDSLTLAVKCCGCCFKRSWDNSDKNCLLGIGVRSETQEKKQTNLSLVSNTYIIVFTFPYLAPLGDWMLWQIYTCVCRERKKIIVCYMCSISALWNSGNNTFS